MPAPSCLPTQVTRKLKAKDSGCIALPRAWPLAVVQWWGHQRPSASRGAERAEPVAPCAHQPVTEPLSQAPHPLSLPPRVLSGLWHCPPGSSLARPSTLFLSSFIPLPFSFLPLACSLFFSYCPRSCPICSYSPLPSFFWRDLSPSPRGVSNAWLLSAWLASSGAPRAKSRSVSSCAE